MEMNKKSGGGDVRAEALAWDDEWDKAKNDCKGTVLLQSKMFQLAIFQGING